MSAFEIECRAMYDSFKINFKGKGDLK